MTTIRGLVRNTRGESVGDVFLAFVNRSTGLTTHLKSRRTGDYNGDVSPGEYTVVATAPGYQPRSDVVRVQDGGVSASDHNIELSQNGGSLSPVASPPGSPPGFETNGLLALLNDKAFNIEADINERETLEAIRLFARINLVLGTKVRREISGEIREDILGIRALYFGLKDGSLLDTLNVNSDSDSNSTVWDVIKTKLKDLTTRLDQSENQFNDIARQAKRQFNLGTTNNVLANTQFPTLFNRYVELASDPRLSFDIRKEKNSDFSDKTRVYEAIDLLRELKQVVLQVVRSLSRYGTVATEDDNIFWGDLAEDALDVLRTVANHRTGKDQDLLTTWATLAFLTGQNPEILFPYVTLAKHGTRLLQYAKEIYDLSSGRLEDFEEVSLLDLFQPEKKEFYTTRLRKEAYLIKRYPLPNWR